MNPFDFITAVSFTKDNLIENEPSCEEYYNKYVTNKSLSYHKDSLLYANDMNLWDKHITNKMSFDFYLHSLGKKKRFAKWHKRDKENEETINIIRRHYGCNIEVAKTYLDIMSDDDLKMIQKQQEKGGEI